MKGKQKAYFNWSGGKDSALALYHTLKDQSISVERLLTTTNDHFNRVAMHGVRNELLFEQVKQLDIPLEEVRLPEMPSMATYDQKMKEVLQALKNDGFTHSVFGDIFLEDLKTYRDKKLAEIGLKGYYPIWKRDTNELIHEFLDLGFKTILVCVNGQKLPSEFAGRVIDRDFIKDLPKGVDPCGENGEFHTFVFDGPIFKTPIPIELGELVYKEYDAPKSQDDSCHADVKPAGYFFQDIFLANN